MTPYFLTILWAVGFGLAAQKCKIPKDHVSRRHHRKSGNRFGYRICLFFAISGLVFTAGFRYYIGTDFGAYYKAYSIFGGNVWRKITSLDEPVISIVTTFISNFTMEGAVYIFTFSLFTVSVSAYITVKNVDSIAFALALYVFCGAWHGSFNGVRQYIAATFILMGYRYILEKKFWKYAFFVFLAYCSHVSAIVMILPYFFLRNKIRFWNTFIMTVGTILVSANYDLIFSFVEDLKEQEIAMGAYMTSSVNILRVLANCAPAAVGLVLHGNRKLGKEETFYLNTLIFNAAAMVAASNSTYLARIGIYTGIFIPIALEKLIVLNNKKTQAFLRFVIIAFYAVFWYYEISISPALNPFCWVWNR